MYMFLSHVIGQRCRQQGTKARMVYDHTILEGHQGHSYHGCQRNSCPGVRLKKPRQSGNGDHRPLWCHHSRKENNLFCIFDRKNVWVAEQLIILRCILGETCLRCMVLVSVPGQNWSRMEQETDASRSLKSPFANTPCLFLFYSQAEL